MVANDIEPHLYNRIKAAPPQYNRSACTSSSMHHIHTFCTRTQPYTYRLALLRLRKHPQRCPGLRHRMLRSTELEFRRKGGGRPASSTISCFLPQLIPHIGGTVTYYDDWKKMVGRSFGSELKRKSILIESAMSRVQTSCAGRANYCIDFNQAFRGQIRRQNEPWKRSFHPFQCNLIYASSPGSRASFKKAKAVVDLGFSQMTRQLPAHRGFCGMFSLRMVSFTHEIRVHH